MAKLKGGTYVAGTLTTEGMITALGLNGLTFVSLADGFSIAGGTTSRTLTVAGANKTLNGVGTSLSLAGGAYALTLTMSASTNVTLPPSGTLAKVDSQTFTGTPAAPTAATGTATTQLATTAFVNMEAIKYALVMG